MPAQSDPVDDDLTRVSGIEPDVAGQLHDAGIHTVAELARATVEQVVAACGNGQVASASAQGWIDQAAELVAAEAGDGEGEDAEVGDAAGGDPEPGVAEPGVAEPGVAEPGVAEPGDAEPGDAEFVDSDPPAPVPAASGQARLLPRRTFSVEVWVDRHAERVARTRLVHLETQDAAAWSGWSRSRLLDFMEKRIGHADPEPPATAGSAGPEPGPRVADAATPAPDVVPVAAAPVLAHAAADRPSSSPALAVHRFGLVKAAAPVMWHGEIAARLRLDSGDLDLPPGCTAEAQVELLAQPRGAGRGRAEVIATRTIDLVAGRQVDAPLRGRLPDREPPFTLQAVVKVLVDQPGGHPAAELSSARLDLVPAGLTAT